MSRVRTVAALAAGAMLLAGCLVGCGGRTYVDPASGSAVAAREQAEDRIDARLAEIRAVPVRLVPLAEVARNECVRGQHNWKVDDPYDSRCGLEVVAAFGFDGEFVAGARQVFQTVRDRGWRTELAPEGLDDCGEESCPDPGELASGRYERGDGDLTVEFASADTPRDELEWKPGFSRVRTEGSCDPYAYHCEVRGTPWGGPWREARHDHRYLLILEMSAPYASTGT